MVVGGKVGRQGQCWTNPLGRPSGGWFRRGSCGRSLVLCSRQRTDLQQASPAGRNATLEQNDNRGRCGFRGTFASVGAGFVFRRGQSRNANMSLLRPVGEPMPSLAAHESREAGPCWLHRDLGGSGTGPQLI